MRHNILLRQIIGCSVGQVFDLLRLLSNNIIDNNRSFFKVLLADLASAFEVTVLTLR